ncbi:multiple epidermal growth factor-like domains protein 6 [Dreissena polymorpha]|uniref:multiple epidermal growth factor-like domains protein 6 n=1 Tax=Dreissena polymorpha TaxID=45954 RepID=UPI0022648591|nr:multiple epidermal growth factor-like domains protein 6 [Dreissena polymorpha]
MLKCMGVFALNVINLLILLINLTGFCNIISRPGNNSAVISMSIPVDVQHNCDYIHTKGRTKKMKIVLVTSMLFATLVGNGQCDSSNCQGEETNFTRPIKVLEAERRTTTMYRMEKRTPDCSRWNKFWNWLTEKCDIQNIVVSYSHVYYINVTKTDYVVECCPGHTNTSGYCIQGCGIGTYGPNCTFNCSCVNIYALNRCDRDTGYCLCSPGYYGHNCTNECGHGYYGSNCSYRCICDNNATCDKQNGKCNCTETPGWTGTACEKKCNNDTFGRDCADNCTCNENQTCDHVNGTCTCKEGHTGQNCSEECANMTYGADCTEKCKCQKNTTKSCDRMNGTCTCNPGYNGIFCMQECDPGYYGNNCSMNCSDNCIGTHYCHHETGECICLGKKGKNCTEECGHGYYGSNCSYRCICDNNATCDKQNGKCNCTETPGWTGTACEKKCINDTFGRDCVDNCTCNENQTCDHVNGTCTCKEGHTGQNCSEEIQK